MIILYAILYFFDGYSLLIVIDCDSNVAIS